jgi:uncharacterized membrane protein
MASCDFTGRWCTSNYIQANTIELRAHKAVSWPLGVVRGHPRLFLAAAAGMAIWLILTQSQHPAARLLLAWNAGAWFYFISAGIMIALATPQTLRERAAASDEGRLFILLLTSLAAIASMAAIVAELAAVKDITGVAKGLHVGLAAITILTAWLFIHLCFAHEYLDEVPDAPGKSRAGLVFPGTDEPDYYDFLYFSYVIGVACQTADVGISSGAMRRTAAVHGVLAFFFNSAVLALTINIAAGLI